MGNTKILHTFQSCCQRCWCFAHWQPALQLDRGRAPPADQCRMDKMLPLPTTRDPMAGNRAESVARSPAARRAWARSNATQHGATEARCSTQNVQTPGTSAGMGAQQSVRYALAASAVDEWRWWAWTGTGRWHHHCKSLTLQSGDILWSGTGGKSGWSREALSAVAQKLIRELLQSRSVRCVKWLLHSPLQADDQTTTARSATTPQRLLRQTSFPVHRWANWAQPSDRPWHGDAGIPARAWHCRGRGPGIQSLRTRSGCARIPLGVAGARHRGLALWPLAGRALAPCCWQAWVALHGPHDQFPRSSFWAG